MADVELLPLPEWTKRDDLGGLVPSEVRSEMHAYARANMEPPRAEIERLRAEVELWRHKAAVHQYRRKRLAEALRWAERHCPCGARPESPDTHPHVPGCLVGAALAQEDHND